MNIGNIEVIIKNGNVALENADCIVVPEFNDCASYGGVGAAISDCGMRHGLNIYHEAVQQNPLTSGQIMITESGLKNIKLAHLATVSAEKAEQFRVVFEAVVRLLAEAEKQGIKTIAMPELGTGIIGYLTQEQSARAIFAAVNEYVLHNSKTNIERLTLVIFRNSTTPAENVLARGKFDYQEEIGAKEFSVTKWFEGMGYGW